LIIRVIQLFAAHDANTLKVFAVFHELPQPNRGDVGAAKVKILDKSKVI
jgi:hypothetical protein